MAGAPVLALDQFLPYRLSVLANRLSRDLSRLYAEQFDLTIAQWRVMAVVASHKGYCAEQVCQYTEMDKVAVSRSVNALVKRRYIHRRRDATDKRRCVLKLSAAGLRLYARIVPLVHEYESRLLERLDQAVHTDILATLDKLDAATSDLATRTPV